ncbi:hypothetical protein [Clostridium sp. C8-1-8]|uniref:hypothetical protein n=1 Tax=Clostridium sp. C8-1-8 TaxID=2698831 RepID=UPI00136A102B|nr:hypothetical protein [Clostridium sp. C8-1-8]
MLNNIIQVIVVCVATFGFVGVYRKFDLPMLVRRNIKIKNNFILLAVVSIIYLILESLTAQLLYFIHVPVNAVSTFESILFGFFLSLAGTMPYKTNYTKKK